MNHLVIMIPLFIKLTALMVFSDIFSDYICFDYFIKKSIFISYTKIHQTLLSL